MSKDEDHFLISIVKNNIFPLLGLVGALIGLYSMTQTLPLKQEIIINQKAILGIETAAQAKYNDVEKHLDTKANKETVEIQYATILDRLDRLDQKIDQLFK